MAMATTTTTTTTTYPYPYPSSSSQHIFPSCAALHPRRTCNDTQFEDEEEDVSGSGSLSSGSFAGTGIGTGMGSPEAGESSDEDRRATTRIEPEPETENRMKMETKMEMEMDVEVQAPYHQPPRPIVVTYGPFHDPAVDVAVAYGQMVCYLWFWSPHRDFDPSTTSLQLQPHPHFIHFLSKVITQTQLSKTVLVLALHYLWLLKRPVMGASAAADSDEASLEGDMGPVLRPSKLATSNPGNGSQYTVSVVALMLANKFMDDNTYTNKSWASICGVTLEKINSMEREFLVAINHSLHVDVNRFMSWIRIMQSFFIQRQSRYSSHLRHQGRAPNPHPHALATHSLVAAPTDTAGPSYRDPQNGQAYAYQRHYSSGGRGVRPAITYRARATSRPRHHSTHYHRHHHGPTSNSRPQTHAYHSDNDATASRSRARSASPQEFQFTFEPPPSNPTPDCDEWRGRDGNRDAATAHGTRDGRRERESSTASLRQRPVVAVERPFTGHEFGRGNENGSGSGEYGYGNVNANANANSTAHPFAYAEQSRRRPVTASVPITDNSSRSIGIDQSTSGSMGGGISSLTHNAALNANTNGSVNALIDPSPILVNVPSARSKRSASQAFSPRSAEPPRPHPEDRAHANVHHEHIVHPHPVRRSRAQFIPHHAHHSATLSHYPSHAPHLASYPVHHAHPHPHVHAQRRMNQVHEILASNSRPSTAVEVGFARMSLAPEPSPVSDSGYSYGPKSGASMQPSHTPYPLARSAHSNHQVHALAQLAAPYDPYSAPAFRDADAREDEPLKLQYYQLAQGGRGVLRYQPVVDLGVEVPSHDQRAQREDGYRYRCPPNLAFSTPTDDDESMSSGESNNGAGWECQQPPHLQPYPQLQVPSHARSHPPPPRIRTQSQLPARVRGGYSLPPLSVVLGETQPRFASPLSSVSAPPHHHLQQPQPFVQTPIHEGIKYAQFANAGPPASYAPQWGPFHSPAVVSASAPSGNQFSGGPFQSPASAQGLMGTNSSSSSRPFATHHYAHDAHTAGFAHQGIRP